MNVADLQLKFKEKFKSEDYRTFFAPGRVNLIGEHTDYNGGYVFPCALDFGTYLIIRKNGTDSLNFASINMELEKTVDVNSTFEKQGSEWTNYVLGVLKEFQKKELKLEGMDFLFYGNIPNKSGLSSSASLEVVTAYAINSMYNCNFDRVELSLISQRAEREFVGVTCGIMDQFIIANGKTEHALALDCNTLKFEEVPCEIGDYRIVIGNTCKSRGLADSKYNERVAECAEAVENISNERKIGTLCELTNQEFETLSANIENPVVKARARHAISENQRVFKAIDALKANQLEEFGQLMNQSHNSLRDDYEVTGFELDTMVEEARKIEGTIGARMTGAGFGGCTVSLVHKDSVEEFIKTVGENYENKTKLTPEFYVANVGDGVTEL
jgi:galactokinase